MSILHPVAVLNRAIWASPTNLCWKSTLADRIRKQGWLLLHRKSLFDYLNILPDICDIHGRGGYYRKDGKKN